jgi:hypothetical protein
VIQGIPISARPRPRVVGEVTVHSTGETVNR